MKQCLLLIVSFCFISLVSCQKKQYAHFQNSIPINYAHATKKAVTPIADPTTTQADAITLPSAPAENFSASNAETTIEETKAVVAEKTESLESKMATPKTSVKAKMSFVQKVKAVSQLRKLSKQISKKSATAANPKGNPDTTALISLLAGILGIILLFTSLGLVGLVLGVVAIVLGAVSLKSTNKRILSILGITIGGLIVLLFLIGLIFLAALIAAI